MHSPFSINSLVTGTELNNDLVTATLLHHNRIYLGTEKGDLLVFDLAETSTSKTPPTANLTVRHRGLTTKQRSIDQLIWLEPLKALACLSGGDVTIHALPSLALVGTSFGHLTKTNCSSFTSTTYHASPPAGSSNTLLQQQQQQQIHTVLALACRRRLIFLMWSSSTSNKVDSSPPTVKEISLPHQIRGMQFNNETEGQSNSEAETTPLQLFAGFSTGEYGIITLPRLSSSTSSSIITTITGGAAKIRKVQTSNLPSVNSIPVLGELFTPVLAPSTLMSNDASNSSVNAAAAAAAASTSTTSTTTVDSISVSKTTSGGALGSLGLGSLSSLGGLTTKKVEKNDVVLIPRRKRKTRKTKDEEDWLWASEWGWEDEDFGGEVVVVRDNLAQVLGISKNDVPRTSLGSIAYSSPVEGTIVSPPYIVSLLSNLTLSIHTTDTLTPIQSLSVPAPSPSSTVSSARLLTCSSSSPIPPFLIVTTSSEVASASTIPKTTTTLWIVTCQTWEDQIMELIEMGSWSNAIRWYRLYSPFARSAPSTNTRQQNPNTLSAGLLKRLAILRSWELFTLKRYDLAIDAFIRLDLSPVKVVGLYEEKIAGKLRRDQREQEEVFGGRSTCGETEEAGSSLAMSTTDAESSSTTTNSPTTTTLTTKASHHHHHQHLSLGSRSRNFLRLETAAGPSSSSLNRSGSVDSKRKEVIETKKSPNANLSVDELVRFLTDRRQQYNKALSLIPPSQRPSTSHSRPEASLEDLFRIPDVPLSELSEDELVRVAEVVDTALFKCYLETKPVMVGPLCRIENWCRVEEIEGLLLQVKKYRELLDLYNGKNMHEKAVSLLRKIAEDEEDEDEKVDPTIRYLQKLGSSHLSIIFEAAQWVFKNLDISFHSKSSRRSSSSGARAQKIAKGLEIFIGDLEEIESLPRREVMCFLETINEDVCIGYLEHIVLVMKETRAEFHEKLIELYLVKVEKRSKNDDEDERRKGVGEEEGTEMMEVYTEKLLGFLESSTCYRADRMLGRLPSSSSTSSSTTTTTSSSSRTISNSSSTSTMTATNKTSSDTLALVRALLLGRLGRHEGALQIYVHQLASPQLAEEYCRRVSKLEPNSKIFHILLRIYLRPRSFPSSSSRQSGSEAAGKQATFEGTGEQVVEQTTTLFEPALNLISKYAHSIDPIIVFDLLPPLIPLSQLNTYLRKTCQRSIETKRELIILKGINKTISESADVEKLHLQERRVLIGNERVCSICGKRLGNSVLAIWNPRGEVVHYTCRERFQRG